jgi:hypothetical protein
MKMTQRTAKLASAIFASLVASAAFVTASHSAPVEADKCLSGPKGAPPAGGHWDYRVDRTTKRACWYIGDAKAKVSRAAPEISPQAANPVSPPNSASTQQSIANARAELPLPPARRAPEATAAVTGPPAAQAASPTQSPHANAEDANAQRSVVASRWFEPTSMASSAPSQSAAATTNRQPISEAAPPPPAAATLRLAAADPSAARSSGTIQQLLIAIVGALALAGLLASAIFRLNGARGSGRRKSKMSVNRGVNWDLAGISRPTLSDDAGGAASWRGVVPLPEGSLPRDPRPASDPDERIGQMLTRLARSAAS